MSYTVVKDNDRLEVRASLSTREELDQLVEKLNGQRSDLQTKQPPKEKTDE